MQFKIDDFKKLFIKPIEVSLTAEEFLSKSDYANRKFLNGRDARTELEIFQNSIDGFIIEKALVSALNSAFFEFGIAALHNGLTVSGEKTAESLAYDVIFHGFDSSVIKFEVKKARPGKWFNFSYGVMKPGTINLTHFIDHWDLCDFVIVGDHLGIKNPDETISVSFSFVCNSAAFKPYPSSKKDNTPFNRYITLSNDNVSYFMSVPDLIRDGLVVSGS